MQLLLRRLLLWRGLCAVIAVACVQLLGGAWIAIDAIPIAIPIVASLIAAMIVVALLFLRFLAALIALLVAILAIVVPSLLATIVAAAMRLRLPLVGSLWQQLRLRVL